MARFDIFADQGGIGDSGDGSASTSASMNGNGKDSNAPGLASAEPPSSTHSASPQKQPPADSEEPPDLANEDIPPSKKRKADNAVDADAVFAAKLQAEENLRARPTRGGTTRKAAPAKKKAKSKPKTAKKVKAEDESDLESGSDTGKKEVNRSGGFHVSCQSPAPRPDANVFRNHSTSRLHFHRSSMVK